MNVIYANQINLSGVRDVGLRMCRIVWGKMMTILITARPVGINCQGIL
ncbi:MAG: hypothetical protein AAF383_05315 [Cyanobacteria bacterium P01_A01_bin.83]